MEIKIKRCFKMYKYCGDNVLFVIWLVVRCVFSFKCLNITKKFCIIFGMCYVVVEV